MVIIILYCYNYFGDKIMAKSNSFFNIDMLVLSLLKVSDFYGDEIVNKKVRVYYHIEPIGRDYLEKTITDFRKNIKGVFDIIEYGEVEKNE